MKNNIIKYMKVIGLIVIGLVLGYIFFSNSGESNDMSEHDHSKEKVEKEEIWTCSMHPQIRQQEPGDCPICGMDLIPLEDNNISTDPNMIELSESAVELANIETKKVRYEIPQKRLVLNGKVKLDERKIHNQISHFSGRIEKLFVNFTGQKVSKGQKIASIYSPDLVNAQKEIFESVKLKNSMPELYKAAIEKLKLLKLTDEQINSILDDGKIQEEINILADANGFVNKLNISEGNWVKNGDVLFEIADINNLWILFEVYEQDLQWIKTGDKINFTVSSIPDKDFSATIKYIDPFLDNNDRTVKVRAEINNSDNKILPEMFVQGIVFSDKYSNQKKIIIPKTAVLWTGKRSIVYVKNDKVEKPTFVMREVILGSNLGDSYIIEDGLDKNDEVVTYGAFKIDASAQLAGKNSSMNQPEEKYGSEVENVDKIPFEFIAELKELILMYMDLTDALVQTDSNKANQKVKKLQQTLNNIEMGLLPNEAHKLWMEQYKIIKDKSGIIAGTKSIEEQRKAFVELSEAIIKSAKNFDVGLKLFIVHCPMANNDEGADWLSLKNEVLNPYFGDMMLNCGEVKEEIGK